MEAEKLEKKIKDQRNQIVKLNSEIIEMRKKNIEPVKNDHNELKFEFSSI